MKKTISMNLGGISFIIDEDAFNRLEQYLNAIRSKFQNKQEQEEILQDIEYRMAELLSHSLKLNSRSIVGLADVDNSIRKMGDPSTIAGEEGDTKTENNNSKFTQSEKKLFRNPDDKIVSGICSGLSAYLGLHDPIWIRVLFIIIGLISGGSALVAYIIGIIIIPEANTNSQKLQMKGQPVTIQNLEENLESVRNSLNNSKFSQTLHTIVNVALIIIKYFVAIVLLIIGFSILTGLFFGAFQANFDWLNLGSSFNSIKCFLIDDINLFILTWIAAILVIGIPALALIILGVKILMKRSFFNRTAKLILIGLWIIGLILGSYVIKKGITQVSYVGIHEETIPMKTTIKLLKIYTNEDMSYEIDNNHISINGQKIKQDQLFIPNTNLDIKRSNSDKMYLLKLQKSNGKSDEAALELAKSIKTNIIMTDSSLFLDQLFQIMGDKPIFRNQRVRYTLYIPLGTKIYLTSSLKNFIYDIKNKHNMFDDYMVGHTWQMKEDGLECIDCSEKEIMEGDANDVTDVNSKKTVKIGGEEGDEYELHNGKLTIKKEKKVIKVIDFD